MRVFLGLFFFCVSCAAPTKIKGNPPSFETSKSSSEKIADPYRFVEAWSEKKVEKLNIERILFDGKVYEALLSKEKRQSILITFKRDDLGYVFLSEKRVNSDYAWPIR